MTKFLTPAAVSFCILLASCSFTGPAKEFRETTQTGPAITQTGAANMANPASVNCLKSGGRSVIKTRTDGSQYGICAFEDNRQCEEWALLRGECPVGGKKITGYDTEAEAFCAISGGTLSDIDKKPVYCSLPNNGGKCEAGDFFAHGSSCDKQ